MKRTVMILALIAAVATPAAAPAKPWEVGALLGLQFPDENLSGVGDGASNLPPTFGLRGDVFLNENWGVFADGLFSSIGSSKDFGDASMLYGRVGAELLCPGQSADHSFYFGAGIGTMSVDLDAADSFSRPYWSFNVGKRWAVSETTRLRAEVRGDRTFGDAEGDAVDRSMRQLEVLVGLSWAFGGAPPEHEDSDGDGVYDEADRCPDTPKGAIVDSHGCPKDSDGDGVLDGLDECPGTPKGVAVDGRGCPKAVPLFQPEAQQQALVLEGVNFEFDSATLTAESSKTLDEVAASLVAWPDVRVEVCGHTDTIGEYAYNMILSQRRADSVKAYLVSKGVAPEQLETKGYGPDQPVATNDTVEGRAQNRRVELRKR